MLKRFFLSAALLGASVLFADAIAIGHSRNGYPLIVPQPRSLTVQSGSFALPAELAVAAPAERRKCASCRLAVPSLAEHKVLSSGRRCPP